MRILVSEDDFGSRNLMLRMLAALGTCEVAVDGREAVEAITKALASGRPYDLVCLDVMMPELDGHAVLTKLRELEAEREESTLRPAKVVMTTALSDFKTVSSAFRLRADAYLIKPIRKAALLAKLRELGLTP